MLDEAQLLSRATELNAKGKREAAEELLFLLVEHDKLNHAAFHELGQCLAARKNFKAAISSLQTAAQLSELLGVGPELTQKYNSSLEYAKACEQAHREAAVSPAAPTPSNTRYPAVFVNTIPKSGSQFFVQTISRTLKVPQVFTSPGYFPHDHVNVDGLLTLKKEGGMSQNHLDASDFNLAYLSKMLGRWVLHIRDPRQTTLSWTHHMRYYYDTGIWAHPMPLFPEGYFSLSFEQQLDWQIEHHLPDCVNWIERWMTICDLGIYDILLTTYEELVEDEIGLVQKMLRFYGLEIPREQFFHMEKTIENNFRRGDPEEWKSSLTPQQRRDADALVPNSLRARFGWA